MVDIELAASNFEYLIIEKWWFLVMA